MKEEEAVLAWAEKQPWAEGMKNTPQSLPYHNEDVWEHTKMVIRCLPKVPDWETADQSVLFWAALLHDCAKPETAQWDEETSSWAFPKHSIKGEYKARNIMAKQGVEFHRREKICKLIRYHMRIRFALEGHDTNQELAVLSHRTDLKSLCQLMYADHIGRNVEVEPPDIHFEIAKDFGFEKCEFAGGEIYRLMAVGYKPYTTASFNVTLMSGMPCSGKSTWANQQGLPIVSLDAIRKDLKIKPTDRNGQGKVAQEAMKKCKQFLRVQESFIFDATNLTKKMRDKWVNMFMRYNARVKIVYVEVPVDLIFKRNKGKSSPIPEDIITKLYNKIDIPDLTECHEIHYEIGEI